MRLVPLLLAATNLASGCLGAGDLARGLAEPGAADVVPPRRIDEWEPLLSKPRFQGIVKSTATVSSLDRQTELDVQLHQPAGFGDEKLPTILILSPYWALGYAKDTGLLLDWLVDYFVPRGYVVALADMRGTRNSSGCFDFGGKGDQEDGYAIVEWLGTQSWSNGRVGMYGVSHVGMSQVAAAVMTPPHLTTIVPVAAIHSFYRYLYFGGAHYDLNMFTPPAYTAVATLPQTRPTAKNVADTGCKAADYNAKGLSQDGRFDAFWQERDYPEKAQRVNASVFFVHGLLDGNVKFDHVDAMWRAMAARPDAPPIKAFFGQWDHEQPPVEDWRSIVHRWMDHWLLDIDTGMLQEPRVTIQTSDRSWRNETQWPPPTFDEASFYLVPNRLATEPAEGTGSFQDVPQTTRGYEPAGSFLRFDSDPLTQALHVSGTPIVTLQASSDKASTHWAILAYDVAPDGTAILWDRGYLDSKQRNGLEKDEPLTPNAKTLFEVRLFPTDYRVAPGHRLRLLVESSDGCGYVVQPIATRCGDAGIISDTTLARNTIYYGADQPSRIWLPLDDGAGATP